MPVIVIPPRSQLIDLQNPINRNDDLANGLLGWWLTLAQRDKPNAQLWADILKLNNIGIAGGFANTFNVITHKGGQGSIHFDGGVGSVGKSFPAANFYHQAPFTVSFWIYSNASSGVPFCFINPSSVVLWQFTASATTITFATGGLSVTSNTNVFNTGTWNHILGQAYLSAGGTFTGVINLYVNGFLQATHSQMGATFQSGGGQIYMGNTTGGSACACNLDDLCYYNRFLSPTEVLQVYSDSISGHPRLLNRVTNVTYIPPPPAPPAPPAPVAGLLSHFICINTRDHQTGQLWADTGVMQLTATAASGFGNGMDTNISLNTRPGGYAHQQTVFDMSSTYSLGTSHAIFCWNKRHGAGAFEFINAPTVLGVGATKFFLYQTDNTYSGINLVPDDNAWHHFGFVRQDGHVFCYLDGELFDTINVTPTAVAFFGGEINTGSGGIGSYSYMDDLRVYNRSFSANEVYQLYANSISGNQSPLVDTILLEGVYTALKNLRGTGGCICGGSATVTSTSKESVFSTCGTYTWTCPEDVNTINVTCVGGQGGNSGFAGQTVTTTGIIVTQFLNYTVSVGCGGVGLQFGTASSFYGDVGNCVAAGGAFGIGMANGVDGSVTITWTLGINLFGTGGAVCGGHGFTAYTFTPIGGAICGGHSPLIYNITGLSGGAICGGGALLNANIFNQIGSGGCICGGNLIEQTTYQTHLSGGVLCSGAKFAYSIQITVLKQNYAINSFPLLVKATIDPSKFSKFIGVSISTDGNNVNFVPWELINGPDAGGIVYFAFLANISSSSNSVYYLIYG